ncbi:MAG: enoyl-CoA hydratase/isomerase family protein [Deltaproteobacteria bacterium]|nr:enoyl-CoA hydratase/isomerase family protein [Deltaproteobacteria bacterium]
MKTYNTIIVEKQDPVGIITLNRPEKLNAMNLEMKNEIFDALSEMEVDDDIKAVIMAGAGRAFSSGHDNDDPVEVMPEFASLKEEELLFNLDKPTIAAVHGYTLGDAMQQALLCDIIIASENTILGFIGPKVGALCYGAFTVLPAIVGRHKANELLFTCDQISAEEGHRIGLVNKVVPHDELMSAAIEMAGKIAQWSPASIKYTKRAMRMTVANDIHKDALNEGWAAILGAMAGQQLEGG